MGGNGLRNEEGRVFIGYVGKVQDATFSGLQIVERSVVHGQTFSGPYMVECSSLGFWIERSVH